MGRPLNKKFFGNAAGRIATTARIGGGNELCFITSQRSNSKYTVDSEAGPSTRSGICKLVDGAPAAENEMQVTVQPENAQTPLTAQIAFTSAGGTGALLTVSIDNPTAHYGYHAPGTNVGIDGTTDGTVDFTVSNGKIVTITINTAGSANTDSESPNPLSQAAAANPPLQNARIINARTVKTFPAVGGNTYLWPIVGSDDGAGPSGRTEADLQTQ